MCDPCGEYSHYHTCTHAHTHLRLQCAVGDAIVWWRACVIWRNKVVYVIGPLLISLTVGTYPRPTGANPCSSRLSLSADVPVALGFVGYHEPQIVPTTTIQLLDIKNTFLEACAILSLVTNALATFLIAYKAWCVLERLTYGQVFAMLMARSINIDQEAQAVGQEAIHFDRDQVAGP